MRQIRPASITVTSNFHPNAIWEEEVDRKAINRRFKVVHMTAPFNK